MWTNLDHTSEVYSHKFKVNGDSFDTRIQSSSGYSTFVNMTEAPGYDFSRENTRFEFGSAISSENSSSPLSSPSSFQLLSSDWPDKLPQPSILLHLYGLNFYQFCTFSLIAWQCGSLTDLQSICSSIASWSNLFSISITPSNASQIPPHSPATCNMCKRHFLHGGGSSGGAKFRYVSFRSVVYGTHAIYINLLQMVYTGVLMWSRALSQILLVKCMRD